MLYNSRFKTKCHLNVIDVARLLFKNGIFRLKKNVLESCPLSPKYFTSLCSPKNLTFLSPFLKFSS